MGYATNLNWCSISSINSITTGITVICMFCIYIFCLKGQSLSHIKPLLDLLQWFLSPKRSECCASAIQKLSTKSGLPEKRDVLIGRLSRPKIEKHTNLNFTGIWTDVPFLHFDLHRDMSILRAGIGEFLTWSVVEEPEIKTCTLTPTTTGFLHLPPRKLSWQWKINILRFIS